MLLFHFFLGRYDDLGSKFVETFCKDGKAPFAKRVRTDLTTLFGGLQHKGDAHVVTDAMKMGHAAQPIIAGRDDVTKMLKDVYIKFIKKLHQDGTLNSELWKGIDLDEMKDSDVDVVQKPGMSILPSMQCMASAPDMLTKSKQIAVPVEVKFTSDYKGPIDKYYSQCQMQILTTGGPFSILLLANASTATMANVADVAAICDVITHVILPDSIWQSDIKFAAQFLVSICKQVTPQLLTGAELPCAPVTLQDALTLPINAISGVKSREGRSFRLAGCQAQIVCKYVANFKDGQKQFYPPVRMSASISANDAELINERIRESGKNGFFLLGNDPDHAGCAPPISLDNKYSQEQWVTINKSIMDLHAMSVSNSDISRHLLKTYQLKKSSQDIANILSRLTIVNQASQGKVLPTQTSELIDALDSMPCVSVVLAKIVTNDSLQVVRHIIRIKGFSGEDVRIAYIDYNDHAVIKEFSPHSLISCHMDSALPFPSNSPGIEPYLHHFDFSKDKVQGFTGTKVVLDCTIWVSLLEMLAYARTPETLINDSTCNYGNTGNSKFNLSVGACPNGTTLTVARSFFSETRRNFVFLFQFALFFIYGELIKLVVNCVADGNDEVHRALHQAIESGYLGTKNRTVVRTCFFHAVVQKFLKDYLSQKLGLSKKTFDTYGFQEALAECTHSDGGVGLCVYYWMKWLVYNITTESLLLASMEKLYLFIAKKPISEESSYNYPSEIVYTRNHQLALVQFVQDASSNLPLMASCHNPSDVDFDEHTSSRLEGEFGVRKMDGSISSKSTATSVVRRESSLAERREISSTLDNYRDANAVPSNLVGDANFSTLRSLTPKCRDYLQHEILKSKNYNVFRISSFEFLIRLSETVTNRSASQQPHLWCSKPEDEDTLIIVVEDTSGVRRLLCKCLRCKSLRPCRKVLAIKAGRVDQCDVHFRYNADFLNGVYTFVTRSVSDLSAHRGALFSPADDARHAVVPSPLETVKEVI